MSVTKVPPALRDAVRSRAASCCEYCLLHESDVYEPHEVDHIIAEQHGGKTTAENLAFACWDCNRRKGPNISSVDPETGQTIALFNPRRHVWNEHFRLEHFRIVPLTAIGRATITLLCINSPERLSVRAALAELGRYPANPN